MLGCTDDTTTRYSQGGRELEGLSVHASTVELQALVLLFLRQTPFCVCPEDRVLLLVADMTPTAQLVQWQM